MTADRLVVIKARWDGAYALTADETHWLITELEAETVRVAELDIPCGRCGYHGYRDVRGDYELAQLQSRNRDD